MGTQKQLCIVKIIKIIDGISGAEFYPFDFLQIDIKYFLHGGGLTAESDTLKRFLHRVLQLTVKQGRQCGIVYLVVSRFRCIIYDFPSVHQHHKLIVIYMDYRSVTYRIIGSFYIFALPGPDASGKYRSVSHVSRFIYFQPLVCQSSGH